jgi:hypothetical protein
MRSVPAQFTVPRIASNLPSPEHAIGLTWTTCSDLFTCPFPDISIFHSFYRPPLSKPSLQICIFILHSYFLVTYSSQPTDEGVIKAPNIAPSFPSLVIIFIKSQRLFTGRVGIAHIIFFFLSIFLISRRNSAKA